MHAPALPRYPPRRGVYLFALTEEVLLQIAHEQYSRVQIAPYHSFSDVDGDLELYTCAVASVTSRQGGMKVFHRDGRGKALMYI